VKRVHFVAQTPHGAADDALYVGKEHLSVEPKQDGEGYWLFGHRLMLLLSVHGRSGY
jgi:hypothetical protein